MNFKRILQTVVEQEGLHRQRISVDPSRRAQSLEQMRQKINVELAPALDELPELIAAAGRSGAQQETARAARLSGDLRDLSNALASICDDGRRTAEFTALVSAHARSLQRQAQREKAGPDQRQPLPQQA